MLYSCTHMATVGVKGLSAATSGTDLGWNTHSTVYGLFVRNDSLSNSNTWLLSGQHAEDCCVQYYLASVCRLTEQELLRGRLHFTLTHTSPRVDASSLLQTGSSVLVLLRSCPPGFPSNGSLGPIKDLVQTKLCVAVSVRVPGCQKNTNDGLTRSSCTHRATVGVKGLKVFWYAIMECDWSDSRLVRVILNCASKIPNNVIVLNLKHL